MSDPDTILGACPSCEHELRRGHVLITYERERVVSGAFGLTVRGVAKLLPRLTESGNPPERYL